MALGKNRRRIYVRGLGNAMVRMTSGTPDAAFSSVGYIKGAIINDEAAMVDIPADNGQMIDYLRGVQKVMIEMGLWQNSKDEIDLLKNAEGKLYAMRYSGVGQGSAYQFWGIDQVRLEPSIRLPFAPGERLLPLKAVAVWQDLGYPVPLYYVLDADAEIFTDQCNLWVDTDLGHNAGANRLLDISGFSRHGTINSDFATVWQTGTLPTNPARYLRLDGTNDQVDFGDVLDDDGTADFMIEGWFRVQGADATQQELMSKKTAVTGTGAGFSLYRTVTTNTVSFNLSSAGTSAVQVSAGTMLNNAWKHIAVTIDRNGSGQMYLNGAASGSPVSVSGVTTAANALSYYLGRDASNFGQADIRSYRHHVYGAGNLPTNIAAIIASHYNAEKAKVGL